MMMAISTHSPTPQSTPTVQNTWGVWNVTNPEDEYCVVDGLSESEAKKMAERFTDDPEMVYIDPESGVEHPGEYEARNGGATSDVTPQASQMPKRSGNEDLSFDNPSL